jgi:frataxin
MDHSIFTKLASKEIEYLYESIESQLADIDIDLVSDILYIYTEEGDYVINQHSPSKQIWLSSPLSNTGYFDYNLDKKQWIDKNNESIRTRLAQDLKLDDL